MGSSNKRPENGFLGVGSFGWSTLVEIADITDDEFQTVIDRLAMHFVDHYGAPHIVAFRRRERKRCPTVLSLSNHCGPVREQHSLPRARSVKIAA